MVTCLFCVLAVFFVVFCFFEDLQAECAFRVARQDYLSINLIAASGVSNWK